MKYVLKSTQLNKTYYYTIIGKRVRVSSEPLIFYDSRDSAVVDLYKIQCSFIERSVIRSFSNKRFKFPIIKIQKIS